MKVNLNQIKNIFENRQPGAEAEYSFFSVLVPLVQRDDGLHLLYEVRGKNLDRQPGEICFPGGAVEEGESFQECAIRETCEELGVGPEDIDVICQLDTIYTYNNFAMYCFLGQLDPEAVDNMKPSQVEVADTFTVPLDYLLENPPRVYESRVKPIPPEDFPYDLVTGGKVYNWRGGRGLVPVYDSYEGHVIWGLTARITKRFTEIIRERMGKDV